jgi:hypothetical protein
MFVIPKNKTGKRLHLVMSRERYTTNVDSSTQLARLTEPTTIAMMRPVSELVARPRVSIATDYISHVVGCHAAVSEFILTNVSGQTAKAEMI